MIKMNHKILNNLATSIFCLALLLMVLQSCRKTTEDPNLSFQDVVINELVASNDSTSGISDPAGSFPDWFELYNNTNDEVDLSGFYLSDKYDNITKWQFPDNTFIAANGYLTIWADGDEDEEGLHTSFKLSSGGEHLILSTSAELALDSLTFDILPTNVSFARIPNGTGNFVASPSTFNASND